MKTLFKDVGISAISTVLPNEIIDLARKFASLGNDELEKIFKITGIRKLRHVTNESASDLCLQAARRILQLPQADDIGALIFVSQTRDYVLPMTSCVMQDKLGLDREVLCLDLPSSCSGYIHGLFTSSLLISSGACNQVLLLAGDASSTFIDPQDRSTAMIFGDAGSATLISRQEGKSIYFNMKNDGSQYNKLIVPAQSLARSSCNTLVDRGSYQDSQIFVSSFLSMDGMAVFDFALREVPSIIQETLEDVGCSASQLDFLALHQANQMIVHYLNKLVGVSSDRSPFCAQETGNTGPASLPLLLSSRFSGKQSNLKKILLCGFGAGMSWGTAFTDLSDTQFSLVESSSPGR